MSCRNVQIFIFISIRKSIKILWWNQELNLLKEKASSSNKVWKAAEKPHSGHIFHNVNQTDRLTKLKFAKARDMSRSAIKIAYTTHYQKKVVNSGNVENLNFGVIIILYHVRLMI